LANFLDLEQTLDDITLTVCDLQIFNTVHSEATNLLRQHINESYSEKLGNIYCQDTFNQLAVQLCNLYDCLRATRCDPPESPISLTGETFVPRKTQAWWLHADNTTNLMMHFLKYLSITTKGVAGGQESISNQVNSVVLDNPNQRDHLKIIKVQWSGAGQEVRIKAVDNENRTRSIRTKQKYLDQWVNKQWSLFNLIDKLKARGHDMEIVEPNAKYIQALVDTGSVPGKVAQTA
jgi:hypothetical protein